MTAELLCLAMAVYYEARSEPLTGQAAVAQVVMNRVESDDYPDTVCEVVTQGGTARFRCQFSYWCDGKAENPSHRPAWRRAVTVAKLAMAGALETPAGKATHYHATYAKPYWRDHMELVATIGQHEFYFQSDW